jgi:hypothetical protein
MGFFTHIDALTKTIKLQQDGKKPFELIKLVLTSFLKPWGQFHQHFMSRFCTNILAQKSTNLKCKNQKAVHETFVRKSHT